MVNSSDMLSVLGTIFVVIIVLSLFGSMDKGWGHTTIVNPTRTVVKHPRVVKVRGGGHHHRRGDHGPLVY